MRKIQLEKISEYLDALKKKHGEMRKAVDAGTLAPLLDECRRLVADVCAYIGEAEGRETETAALLRDGYGEMLNRAGAGGNVADHVQSLKKSLFEIENRVRVELKPNKIEMAFLSYKASMSDSLESIYFAAKNDPQCDAYWIPIPYYERNPDGSFGEMRYEGAECYPNMDCTEWDKYDIEARRPDAVFTFAPYDGGNLVTSVHPDFYCERLRALTDCLCYVPYFVTVTPNPDFVPLAGCVYAHKVFLQSEAERKVYVQTFKEKFGNRFGKPEDKFVALGSPKFDKVINAKRSDYELPEEWARIIGDRKVVLYNTSLGAMLRSDERYLEKLRQVIEVFRNRDDVVLWWRPHPLSAATLKAIRPHLYDEYMKIVNEYRGEA